MSVMMTSYSIFVSQYPSFDVCVIVTGDSLCYEEAKGLLGFSQCLI